MKPLAQRHIDWLLANGVTVEAMIHPQALMWDDTSLDGSDWIYVPEDQAYWRPASDECYGPWCMGLDALSDPSTFALGNSLTIHETPLDWLRAGRRWGIYVIDWSRAYDEMQNLPRVTVPLALAETYRAAMKPRKIHLPAVTYA